MFLDKYTLNECGDGPSNIGPSQGESSTADPMVMNKKPEVYKESTNLLYEDYLFAETQLNENANILDESILLGEHLTSCNILSEGMIANFFMRIWEAIKKFFKWIWECIVKFFKWVWNGIKNLFFRTKNALERLTKWVTRRESMDNIFNENLKIINFDKPIQDSGNQEGVYKHSTDKIVFQYEWYDLRKSKSFMDFCTQLLNLCENNVFKISNEITIDFEEKCNEVTYKVDNTGSRMHFSRDSSIEAGANDVKEQLGNSSFLNKAREFEKMVMEKIYNKTYGGFKNTFLEIDKYGSHGVNNFKTDKTFHGNGFTTVDQISDNFNKNDSADNGTISAMKNSIFDQTLGKIGKNTIAFDLSENGINDLKGKIHALEMEAKRIKKDQDDYSKKVKTIMDNVDKAGVVFKKKIYEYLPIFDDSKISNGAIMDPKIKYAKDTVNEKDSRLSAYRRGYAFNLLRNYSGNIKKVISFNWKIFNSVIRVILNGYDDFDLAYASLLTNAQKYIRDMRAKKGTFDKDGKIVNVYGFDNSVIESYKQSGGKGGKK